MRILIYTVYRSGSTTMTQQISRLLNFRNPNNYLLKAHHGEYSHIKTSHLTFDYVFTTVRLPTQVFLSAYIRNFMDTQYPYYLDKSKIKTQQEILDHFMSFDWNSFPWLSFDQIFQDLKDLTGIDIWEEDFNTTKGYGIYDCKNGFCKKLIVLNTDVLNDLTRINEIFFLLKLRQCRRQLHCNGHEHFVSRELYSFLKNSVPPEYRIQYKIQDDKIKQKFFLSE
jgi:hypothetical protein